MRLVLTRHVSEYSPAKTGDYPRIFPSFQNCAFCEKDLKDNEYNNLNLAHKNKHLMYGPEEHRAL